MGRRIGDFSLEELNVYRPPLTNKPDDFSAFWKKQVESIEQLTPNVEVQFKEYPVPSVEVANLTFESWDGTRLKGLFVKPRGVEACPVILSFHGYTGTHGSPIDYLKWTSMGIAVYAFDVRGQGVSPDFAKYDNGTRLPGWMLHGLLQPESYYYTNVYKDLLMQFNWIVSGEALVKHTKIALAGSSQGGGLALSVAGLVQNLDAVISDYPFLAHFERALKIAPSGPYMEIVNYFKYTDPQYKTAETVMRTLGYIDCVHFCEDIHCPAFMQIGLEDDITPPSTVFAAYNHLSSSDKQIEVYPQFSHESNPFHEEKKLEFIKKTLLVPSEEKVTI